MTVRTVKCGECAGIVSGTAIALDIRQHACSPFLEPENLIMSTIHPKHDKRGRLDHYRDAEPMTLREQLIGTLVVLLVILFAILLRSM